MCESRTRRPVVAVQVAMVHTPCDVVVVSRVEWLSRVDPWTPLLRQLFTSNSRANEHTSPGRTYVVGKCVQGGTDWHPPDLPRAYSWRGISVAMPFRSGAVVSLSAVSKWSFMPPHCARLIARRCTPPRPTEAGWPLAVDDHACAAELTPISAPWRTRLANVTADYRRWHSG